MNKDVVEERRKICSACAPGKHRCPQCNCFIAAIIRIRTKTCPLSEW